MQPMGNPGPGPSVQGSACHTCQDLQDRAVPALKPCWAKLVNKGGISSSIAQGSLRPRGQALTDPVVRELGDISPFAG